MADQSKFGMKLQGGAGRRVSDAPPSGSRALKVVLIVLAVLLAAAIAFAVWALYVYDRVYPNVFFAGERMEGLDRAGVEAVVRSVNDKYYKDREIELTIVDEKFVITSEEIGASIDVDATTEAIYSYARSGGPFRRISEALSALLSGHEAQLAPTLDETAFSARIHEIAGAAAHELKEPNYEISGENLVIDLGMASVVIDEENLGALVRERFAGFDFSPLTYEP